MTPTPVIDVDALLDLCQQDTALVRSLATRFVTAAPEELSSLQTILGHGDARALAALLHKIRGSLGIFGADAALEAAADLERRALAGDLSDAAARLTAFASELERTCVALAALAG